mgnify:CR=1 FL=1
MEMIGGYTLVERLEMTIENIKFQKGKVFWDDLEKLELILEALKKKGLFDEVVKTLDWLDETREIAEDFAD